MTDLGTLGGSFSMSRAINGSGAIVGFADPVSGREAFIYSGGSMSGLGSLTTSGTSEAFSINDSGDVIGKSSSTFGASHAFYYTGGVMYDLGTLGAYTYSQALDINNSGQIVGWSGNTSADQHAFLYDGGTMTEIDGLGGWSTVANAINDSGEIVGSSITTGGLEHAYIHKDGATTDLNDLLPAGSDWLLKRAYDINDDGVIVGYGSGGGIGNAGYMLVPLPGGLVLAPPTPGTAGTDNTFDFHGGLPGNKVYLVYGFSHGSTLIPGCGGATVDISSPKAAWNGTVDGNGNASFTASVPPSASGLGVLLQAVEPESCRVSNLVEHTFL